MIKLVSRKLFYKLFLRITMNVWFCWIKYFKNNISVYYVLLIIYNLFALKVYYEEGHWGNVLEILTCKSHQ